MDYLADKLSVKNLLFTKAIPNHVISTPVNGHKIFSCTDCGDKFLFESSLNDHINRKSAKITYMCRYCNFLRIFNNRCNLLSHIRSHAFKTATINVTDLKIELPIIQTKGKSNAKQATSSVDSVSRNQNVQHTNEIYCYECKINISVTGVAYKDRSRHFMQYTNEVYSCPVCLFALPSICALKVHLRLHVKIPPYYCPECGIHLANKNVHYPFNHDCEGFKMMRATARMNCTVPDCCLFHPNDFREHMSKYHLKKVYKCPFCVVACFNETTMEKHLKGHKSVAKALVFYQCEVCPGRYVSQNPKLNDSHLRNHLDSSIYPCWVCGSAFKEVSGLLTHYIKKHNKTEAVETALKVILNDSGTNVSKLKRIYRVVKRCDHCERSFTYKCKFEEIQLLPNECPFKCTSKMESSITPEKTQNFNNSDGHIICHLCKLNLSLNWGEIKKHYAELHKTYKCLDPEIKLTRVDITKYLANKRIPGATKLKLKTVNKISKKGRTRPQNKSTPSKSVVPSKGLNRSNEENELYICNKCGKHYEKKVYMEKHMRTHRDPCMAYQCMECGQSFVVKPSFSKHLLLEHGITDAEDYITNKQCYNESALEKRTLPNDVAVSEEPLRENQCNICREEFEGHEELEKHYRVHGMAFLIKNTSKNSNINVNT